MDIQYVLFYLTKDQILDKFLLIQVNLNHYHLAAALYSTNKIITNVRVES